MNAVSRPIRGPVAPQPRRSSASDHAMPLPVWRWLLRCAHLPAPAEGHAPPPWPALRSTIGSFLQPPACSIARSISGTSALCCRLKTSRCSPAPCGRTSHHRPAGNSERCCRRIAALRRARRREFGSSPGRMPPDHLPATDRYNLARQRSRRSAPSRRGRSGKLATKTFTMPQTPMWLRDA